MILLPSPADPRVNVVMASELMDDSMLEKELMGEVVPFYIYQFQQDGKTVTGLSSKGVNEVVRMINKNPRSGSKIRISRDIMKIEHNVNVDGVLGVQATAFAEDLIRGNTAWGVKFEAYRKKKKSGETYENTFTTEKAITKAERNAKRKLIAETLAVKMIQKIMKEQPNTVKVIDAPEVRSMRRDAPAKVPEAKMTKADRMRMTLQAIGECREVKTLNEWLHRINDNAELDNQEKIKLMGTINDRIKAIKSK